MKVTLRIRRFNPETDKESSYQEYSIEAEPTEHQQRVADAIQDQADEELSHPPRQPVRRWRADQQAGEAPQLHFALQTLVPVTAPGRADIRAAQPIRVARRSPQSCQLAGQQSHFQKIGYQKRTNPG